MKKISLLEIISIGLAVFSMFFGAGNLILPLQVGMKAGNNLSWAMMGFIISSVCLPLISLISIILFEGNYRAFFNRLGTTAGSLAILFCMLIMGPLYVMPRIVTFSHIMISPFLGHISLPLFALLFLGLTFLGTYKESKILDLLGKLVSPALLISLGIIIVRGIFFTNNTLATSTQPASTLFWDALKTGYSTLDVIGAIFFSAVVISILHKNALQKQLHLKTNQLAFIGFQAGIIGLSLLALVYVGMGWLSGLHGIGLETMNPGEVFSAVSFRILGSSGAIIIAMAVLMACYSTIVPLTAVFSEYLQKVSNHAINYIPALLGCLGVTGIVSTLGLTNLLKWAEPIIEITYPALITLALCNLAFKLWHFKPVKLPVMITLLASTVLYFYYSI